MRNSWIQCDGQGQKGRTPSLDPAEKQTGGGLWACPSRRSILMGAALGAAAWAQRRTALAQIALSPTNKADGNVLVAIFLRGGLDGLNAVVPYGDDGYHRLRPTLGLAAPTNRTVSAIDRTLDLNGFFGLNPALAPLHPLFAEGKLGIVHAVGSGDRTRSHFEAMNAMERGMDTAKGASEGGWLARLLQASEPQSPSPLRAVALASVMPDSLRGATQAVALQSLSEFRIEAPPGVESAEFERTLGALYREGGDAIAEAGRETLQVLESLNRLDPSKYAPEHGAAYPQGDLGDALKQVAFLVKSDLGVEVACLDKGGWDTHFGQGRSEGLLTGLLTELGQSLAAFAKDLGSQMSRVTVVAMTEFGRRAYENSTLGTDHGRGSVLFAMGGGVRGGNIYGEWPGLAQSQLEEPGDLRVTTDYRSVLTEVLRNRKGLSRVSDVFPGFAGGTVGMVEA